MSHGNDQRNVFGLITVEQARLMTFDCSTNASTVVILDTSFATHDLLQDQAQIYAQRVQEAGDRVSLLNYPSMIHGFLSFPPFCRGALPAFKEIAAYVRSIESVHSKDSL